MGYRVHYKAYLHCLGLHGVSPRFITTRVAKGKMVSIHISYLLELLAMSDNGRQTSLT